MGVHCLFRLGTSSKRRRVGLLSLTLSSPTTLSSTSTPLQIGHQLSCRGGPRSQLLEVGENDIRSTLRSPCSSSSPIALKVIA
ncbi:hypothetical protein CFP56_003363 [Quercus suber]|uniref:Secreted protein n=1 Tax=Quercus suber TaxID=58331 RepID=A0AAW0LE35_QUESU